MTDKTLLKHMRAYMDAEKRMKAAKTEMDSERSYIIAALDAAGLEEKTIQGITARNKTIPQNRLNTAALKAGAPDVYIKYVSEIITHKFTCK